VRSDAAVETAGGEAGLHTDWTDTQTEQMASARGLATRRLLSSEMKLPRLVTALHVMQTRYSDENCLSVRLSVTRVYCDKTVERSVMIYIPYERTFFLVF